MSPIVAENPPPSRGPGRTTSLEVQEKLDWLRAHPGEWLLWSVGVSMRPVHGPAKRFPYVRAYRRDPVTGKHRAYVCHGEPKVPA